MTLEHGEGDLPHIFTMAPPDGYQAVTLSGITGNYMDQDTSAANGDTLEIPTNLGFSNLILTADADVVYDAAVDQLTTHERRLYVAATNTWDTGDVTVNQVEEGVELLPPSWRSTPSPPDAVVGTPYSYPIGALVNGSRPITLSESPGSTPLPAGLDYNSAVNPETIEGTINAGSGTITVNGIVTRAQNGA
jgi:hypothetical protein